MPIRRFDVALASLSINTENVVKLMKVVQLKHVERDTTASQAISHSDGFTTCLVRGVACLIGCYFELCCARHSSRLLTMCAHLRAVTGWSVFDRPTGFVE